MRVSCNKQAVGKHNCTWREVSANYKQSRQSRESAGVGEGPRGHQGSEAGPSAEVMAQQRPEAHRRDYADGVQRWGSGSWASEKHRLQNLSGSGKGGGEGKERGKIISATGRPRSWPRWQGERLSSETGGQTLRAGVRGGAWTSG